MITGAVDSHANGSPDDVDAVALRGASLAFRKNPGPSTQAASSLPTVSTNGTKTNSLVGGGLTKPMSHEALTAATSAERARSPARYPVVPHQESVPPPTNPSHIYKKGSQLEIGSLGQGHHHSSGGVVASRPHQLGTSPNSNSSSYSNSSSTTTTTSAALARSWANSGATTAWAPAYAHLAVPHKTNAPEASKMDANNPSLIAATLAASRSTSPSPQQGQTPRRDRSIGASTAVSDNPVDAAPIPPTESLISMFEQAGARKPGTVVTPRREQKGTPRASPGEVSKGASKDTPRSNGKHVTPESTTPTKVQPSQSALAKPVRKPAGLSTMSDARGAELATQKATQSKQGHSISSVQDTLPAQVIRVRSPATSQALSDSQKKPHNTGPHVPPSTNLQGHSTITSKTMNTNDPPNLPSQSTSPIAERQMYPLTPVSQARKRSPTPRVTSHSTAKLVSPKPTRISSATLNPTIQPSDFLQPSPSPKQNTSTDPQKHSVEPSKGPTPPKPRRSQRFVQSRSTSRPRGSSATSAMRPPVNTMFGLPISTTATGSRASPPPPLPTRKGSVASAPPSPTHEVTWRRPTNAPPSSSSYNMSLNSLTNAMMASSLASSRLTPHNTGHSLPPSILPKRQKSPRLLQTLRHPPPVDEEEDSERQKKSHHRPKLRGAKHVHHEGARKRWREKITERERKRYEAVWASNRGLLLTNASPSASIGSDISTDLSECVANVIVREVWKRSRLPEDELGEIWGLVDRDGRGYLTRPQFVVGMWLIDQRLRGRKAPTKVGDSVWASVNGVTVLRPRRK